MKKYGTYSFKGTAAELIETTQKNKEVLTRNGWKHWNISDLDPTNPNSKVRNQLATSLVI